MFLSKLRRRTTKNTSKAVKEIMRWLIKLTTTFKKLGKLPRILKISPEILLLHSVLSLALRCFGKISILLKPVIPITCDKIEQEFFCSNSLFVKDISDLRIKK